MISFLPPAAAVQEKGPRPGPGLWPAAATLQGGTENVLRRSPGTAPRRRCIAAFGRADGIGTDPAEQSRCWLPAGSLQRRAESSCLFVSLSVLTSALSPCWCGQAGWRPALLSAPPHESAGLRVSSLVDFGVSEFAPSWSRLSALWPFHHDFDLTVTGLAFKSII